ncbi:MAG TPA: Asp-tRNA(Asn)/Glu-tRNA(Gln) amidotransferase subunit GatB [Gemmatimonadales bacterium]|nr:Asp-tRNA(Asn)/Glu-tRNA(Gln) amidotransferase subunit GatB [Gemmatimonadales bacterium]
MAWEVVIGLEVHVQLLTRSKMFCGCANRFGDRPNTNVCPICLGLPGALPVPNAEAVRLAARAALALGCTVHEASVFARKNYFYPDLPKGYQISQFDVPLATRGAVALESPERGRIVCGVTRLHVEEDAGKLLHDRISGKTAVDLNRAGTPLVEIVSEPDLRSPAEAREYLRMLRQILLYTGVSDCNMEEGSLRVDANISIRRPGSAALGVKCELKNLNSFANVERALEAERDRQMALMDRGERVVQSTLLFNAASGQVKLMRSKEESHDYRYFPDPDLPPLVLVPAWIADREAELPELPETKRARLVSAYAVSPYHAGQLAAERPIADYFEAVVAAGAEPKDAVRWVLGDVIAGYNESGQFAVAPARLVALIRLETEGTVSGQAARKIFPELAADPAADARAVAERMGLVQLRDQDALGRLVDEVLSAHPAEVQRFRSGEDKLMGFFVGQVMKRSQGKADPKGVQPVLARKLQER